MRHLQIHTPKYNFLGGHLVCLGYQSLRFPERAVACGRRGSSFILPPSGAVAINKTGEETVLEIHNM